MGLGEEGNPVGSSAYREAETWRCEDVLVAAGANTLIYVGIHTSQIGHIVYETTGHPKK